MSVKYLQSLMKIFHQHNKTSSLQCTIYIYLTKEPSLPLYDTQPLYEVRKIGLL